MADTPKRLHGPAHLTDTAATIYTVPAATTAILRHVRIVNGDTVDRTVTMSIGADAAATRLLDAMTIPAKGVLVWTGFEVLNATETIQAFGSVADQLVATISGVEVT